MHPQLELDTIKPISKNGFVLVRDTSTIYDPETYEEEIRVTTSYVPIKEYKSSLRKIKRKAKKRSRTNLIEVRDTSRTFNSETFEETLYISIQKLTKREYKVWLKNKKSS